jgi:AcrR family transcriptional regulator
MFNAARELFISTGYNKTTMDAIAEHAEVGVATVYTYFGNKETLFAELARWDMTELREEANEALNRLSDNPAEAVMELLTIYDKVRNYISSQVIKDFTKGLGIVGPLRDTARWMDGWRIEQIASVLDDIQKSGNLSQSLPTKEAAEIVNELFNQYYQRYYSVEQPKKAFRQLERRVRLLFVNWV